MEHKELFKMSSRGGDEADLGSFLAGHLVCSFAGEDTFESFEEDGGVEGEAGAVGVFEFEFFAFAEAEFAAAGDLPVAGDAWLGFHEVGEGFFGDVVFFAGEVGAVADEGHIAEENVEELRKFVE